MKSLCHGLRKRLIGQLATFSVEHTMKINPTIERRIHPAIEQLRIFVSSSYKELLFIYSPDESLESDAPLVEVDVRKALSVLVGAFNDPTDELLAISSQ